MTRRVIHTPNRAAGFTLVELLLAITLMSILLGLTYTGLRAATRSAERGEVILAAGGGVRATHQFVRRQLNQMLPLAFELADNRDQTRVVFVGDSTSIQYVSTMPGYLGSGGPQVQLLELVNGDDGGILQFSHALLQGFEEARLHDRDPVVLLEGVQSAGFEFLGRDEEGMLTPWMQSWDQPGSLPVAVRVYIELPEDLQVQWPELVAGVRLDESAIQGAGQLDTTYQQKMRELIKGKGSNGQQ